MPELPEVETIVRRLRTLLPGRKIRSVRVLTPSILRCPPQVFLRGIQGAIIREIRRKGKLILFELEPRGTVLLHLKMTGQVLIEPLRTKVDRHSHLLLLFEGTDFRLRYRDVRKFGFFHFSSDSAPDDLPPLARLGPDPFEIDAGAFARVLSSRKGKIKPLLLNQSLISGLGNIYADESLFRAGIHPSTPASSLTLEQLKTLHRIIRRTLSRALAAQGSTLRDYRNPDGEQGGFQHFHRVYGRDGLPCKACGHLIRKIRVGGRGTHFCPLCQPL